jgi:radical SAM protein with 4Fe4S-binding SPASM domain
VNQNQGNNSASLSTVALPRPYAAPALPTVFTLELTTRCNNRCSGCANLDLRERRAQRRAHQGLMRGWRAIIDQIAEEKGAEPWIVRLSGGEPTLHPEFFEIVAYLERRGIYHALLTTGKWQKPNELVRAYRECRYALGLLISLHGASATTHGAFVETSARSFATTCANIGLSTGQRLRVYTNTVLTRANTGEIAAIAALSRRLGATAAVFNRFVGSRHPLQPEASELRQAIATILDLKRMGYPCRIGNCLPKCFVPYSNEPAAAGFELCHISPEGEVKPDNFTTYSFGALPDQTLRQAWQSEKAWRYRSHLSAACRTCAALPYCRGGQKSPYLGQPLFDELIGRPLTAAEAATLPDEPDKEKLHVLALTSD